MRNLLAVIGVLMAISHPGFCWKYHKKHGYISMDLIRQKTVREHILNGPKYGIDLNYLLEKPPRTNDAISLKRYLDNEYFGEIIIGHPGQRMVVAFDTAWELTWVMSKRCQIFISPACNVHNLYDDTRSSLYKHNGTAYGDSAYNYTGFYSYDTIKIAHSNATNFSFVEMTQVPNSFIGEKADGVVGLGLAPSDGSYEPYFYALYTQKKIKNNLFSIFINRDPQSTNGGSIMLGYINPKHIHKTKQADGSLKPDEITYLDVKGDDIYWQFRMDKIIITMDAKRETHTLCDNGCDAIVDTTSNRIRGPAENIKYIRQLVDAKQFGDLWLLDCSKVRKLPKVDFVLEGHYCRLDGPLYVMQAPQKAEKWNGTLIADKAYSCLQYIPIPVIGFANGTEDCLYLYVYVPRSKISGKENLDVIAYIHGGGFMFGDPVQLAGPDYMMDKDVIFVSFNYRLSILGFLSTADNIVPGNNGLKDQVMALKWIKDNIKYFGGNPNSVTLYGLSAGAVSTHLHYLSPLSKGLFQRGFSQSGTALVPWSIHKKPLQKAKRIAAYFSCPLKPRRKMVECLKRQNGKDLISSVKSLTVFMDNVPFALFGPVVEKGQDSFLNVHPYQLLESGQVYDVPWVASNVNNEGNFPTNLISGLQLWDKIDNWTYLMPYILILQDVVDKNDLVNVSMSIRHFYFNDEPLSEDHLYDMVKLVSDRLFMVDSEKAIRLHTNAVKSPVYYMLFAYEIQQQMQIPGIPRLKGVGHGDDSSLYGPISFMGDKHLVTGKDVEMMRICTNFIESYAKGKMGLFNNVKWAAVEPGSEDLNVLRISSPRDIAMQKLKELAPQEFWSSLPIQENGKFTMNNI